MLTKTKVSTKTKVIVAVVVLAGLAALGYGAGLLPRTSTQLAITSVRVSNVTASSGLVEYTLNKEGMETVEWGVDTNYGSSYSGSVAKLSGNVSLSGLRAGTTYHFRVTARDALGNVTRSADQMFTTSLGTQIEESTNR